MIDKQANTRRLAKNTILLTLRSVFNLFCSLYSSRLILQALGVEDYGIYNAVGGFVSMFWLVTGSLSTAIGRFITVELGRGNKEQLKKVFSMSLNIMLCFGIIVLLLTETFGMWFLQNKMTIPPGRETAAFWVFQFSVVTIVSGFAIVPFKAEIISHEEMGIYAYTGIGETVVRLLLALFLVYGSYRMDTLIVYAIAVMLTTLSIHAFVITYSCIRFSECRFRPFFDKRMFKDMFSYANWHFIENISTTFSGQGVNMAINVFLGPLINSARGLAGTVDNVLSIFVKNFTMALTPQITKSYASGDWEYMKMLTFRGAKFSFFIMLFLSLPLFLEAEFALGVWLVEVPDHTVSFVRLSILFSQLGIIDGVFRRPQNATSNIRNYKIAISIVAFLNFPLAYLVLKLGWAPEWIYIIALVLSFPRIYIIQRTVSKTFHYSLREVVDGLYLKMFLVVLCSAIIPVLIHQSIDLGWWRFLAVGSSCVICVTASVMAIGCNQSERIYILENAKKFIERFRR